MSSEEKLRAIVLRSIPFKDHQSILTVFSETRGICNVLLKGIHKNPLITICSNPLSEVEFFITPTRSDLFRCTQASLLNAHAELRTSYKFISAGLSLANILLKHQYPEESSPSLFLLFSIYLKQIPFFENPRILHGSFLMKFLKHEGTFSSHLSHQIEEFCKINLEEWDTIQTLANATRFESLKKIFVTEELLDKIKHYFELTT